MFCTTLNINQGNYSILLVHNSGVNVQPSLKNLDLNQGIEVNKPIGCLVLVSETNFVSKVSIESLII